MNPIPVDDATLAFPASVSNLMPPMDEIPAEFKRHDGTKWNCLFSDMFYRGLSDISLTPKDGIDPETAWRHISAISGSYEPKHQHKEAAVAYLLSQWFEDATWTANPWPDAAKEAVARMEAAR